MGKANMVLRVAALASVTAIVLAACGGGSGGGSDGGNGNGSAPGKPVSGSRLESRPNSFQCRKEELPAGLVRRL